MSINCKLNSIEPGFSEKHLQKIVGGNSSDGFKILIIFMNEPSSLDCNRYNQQPHALVGVGNSRHQARLQ